MCSIVNTGTAILIVLIISTEEQQKYMSCNQTKYAQLASHDPRHTQESGQEHGEEMGTFNMNIVFPKKDLCSVYKNIMTLFWSPAIARWKCFNPVCLFVCVWLSMKDWCHTNNILQVHGWGCLVVQVMFHALMTSLMTSQDHKVGQILKLTYLCQYLSYSVNQKLKMSEMLMAIFLVYSTSGTTSGIKVCRELNMAAVLKFFKYTTQLQFDFLRYEKIVPNYAKKVFSWWWRHRWRHRVASKSTLYIPLWMK